MRVALVHGTMDRSASFAKVMRLVPESFSYDRAGYGTAVDRPPLDTVAAQAAELLDRLGDEPAVVVGHSHGGNIALAASIERPDLVPAVGVYEVPTAWLPWWPPDTAGGLAVAAGESGTPGDAAEAFVGYIVGADRWQRMPASTKEARRREGAALLADMRAIRPDPPFDPADVPVPVTVGQGSDCSPHHVRATEALLSTLRDHELLVLDGAGHVAHSTHPEAFAGFVRRAVLAALRR